MNNKPLTKYEALTMDKNIDKDIKDVAATAFGQILAVGFLGWLPALVIMWPALKLSEMIFDWTWHKHYIFGFFGLLPYNPSVGGPFLEITGCWLTILFTMIVWTLSLHLPVLGELFRVRNALHQNHAHHFR